MLPSRVPEKFRISILKMLTLWKILLFLLVLIINQVVTQSYRRDEYDCSTIKWSEAVKVTSTDVVVRWDCCNSRDTPSYKLHITSSNHKNCDCTLNTVESTKECSHTFSNLCPNTNYRFTVSKYTVTRSGFYSWERKEEYLESSFDIDVKTRSSAPGRVTMEEAKAIKDTAVNLKWKHDCPNSEVVYNVTWSPDDGSLMTHKLELTVLDLKPVTLYTFLIHACNAVDKTMCSDSHTVLVRTLPGAPSEPAEFEVVGVSSSDIHLRWNHPEVPKGPIDGYKILCQPENNATLIQPILIIVNKTEEHRVTGLEPWTNYSCSIRAFHIRDIIAKITGNQSTLTAITRPAHPDEPPNLHIVDKTSDRLFLKWKHPYAPRGPIDGYVVRATDGRTEIENISDSQEFRFSGLSPWTDYNLTVHAFNMDGNDTLNGTVAIVSGKTRPAEPSAPRDLKVVKTTTGETLLKWKPPMTPNGETHGYWIKNLNDETEAILPGSIFKHHLVDLIPDTNYTFSIFAYNVDGMQRLDGANASVNYKTKPEEPSLVEMVNLMRKDMVRELSKMQTLMRSMLRTFGEENDTGNEKHDGKSLPDEAQEYRQLNRVV